MKTFLKYLYHYVYLPLIKWLNFHRLRIKFGSSYISSKSVIEIGNNCVLSIGSGSRIKDFTYIVVTTQTTTPSSLIIGDNTYIGEFNNIRVAGGSIKIGRNCLISQHVTLVSSNHKIKKDKPVIFQEWDCENNTIIIEDDVWVGANCVILPRVCIHKGAVVAAGSIVTKDVPAFAVVAGNPARILKYRTNE